MGRPTKYTQELEDKALYYIENYDKDGSVIPTHEGMAEYLEVHRDTLYDWAKDSEKGFSDILGKCNSKQARMVINESLKGDYNATIAKLLLGKHGYHDKQDNTLSGPNGKAVEFTGVQFVGVSSKD